MPPTPSTRRRLRAFTLIELLTVVAIIGVLSAILFPAISKARAAAANTQCLSNVRQWGQIILLYATDHKGSYTFSDWADAASGGPYLPYLSNSSNEVSTYRCCPLMPQSKITAGTLTYVITRGTVNGKLVSNSSSLPLQTAANPSNYLLVCDSISNTNNYLTGSTSSLATYISPLFNPALATPGQEEYDSRHGGQSINGVFADGSTRRITGTPAGQGDKNSIYEMAGTWLALR